MGETPVQVFSNRLRDRERRIYRTSKSLASEGLHLEGASERASATEVAFLFGDKPRRNKYLKGYFRPEVRSSLLAMYHRKCDSTGEVFDTWTRGAFEAAFERSQVNLAS